MSAVISPCGKYRYVLTRSLHSVCRWYRPILFIMLNPSTADAEVDDPTIRRCMKFGESFNMTHLTVVNLFAYRATDPNILARAKDPIGPDNDQHLIDQIEKHRNSLIIAAWGAHPFAKERGESLARRLGPFQCLGTTKDNAPRHPLYLPADAEWKEWRV